MPRRGNVIVAERHARVSAIESGENAYGESIFELSWPLIRQWIRVNAYRVNTEMRLEAPSRTKI